MRGLAVGMVLLAGGAMAQERPPGLPMRDVDVTYRSDQFGVVLEQRSRFDAGLQRMRLDTPTPGLWMIVDYRTQTMAMVSDVDHGAVDLPTPPGVMPGAIPGKAVRGARDQVAGLACTEWEGKDSRGQAVSTCLTDDGVMLRARQGTVVLAQATKVQYGAMDPAVFEVPKGYEHVAKRP